MHNFVCLNCKKEVKDSPEMGTRNRNHCPFCLYSLHVDEYRAGDRKSVCHGAMEPIGLTFKKEKSNKYKREDKGEIMLIHKCTLCGKISINRIAGDDDAGKILTLASQADIPQLRRQLFGEDNG
ncbi:MAG: RNHCP domain-containing protein [bacterium]|nr:RNHCP domain-containing protein [bacterium]